MVTGTLWGLAQRSALATRAMCRPLITTGTSERTRRMRAATTECVNQIGWYLDLELFRRRRDQRSLRLLLLIWLAVAETRKKKSRRLAGCPILAGLVYARVGLGLNSADVRMGGDVNRGNGRRFGRICRPSGAGERWKRKWMVRNSFWRACAARCG